MTVSDRLDDLLLRAQEADPSDRIDMRCDQIRGHWVGIRADHTDMDKSSGHS